MCEKATGDVLAGVGAAAITPNVEPWDDLNEDGDRDNDEPFEDLNNNGVHDSVWMAGFSMGRAATGVHDDNWARAIIVEKGDVRVGLVALDVVGFFCPDVINVRLAADDADLDLDHVLVASTHQHEGQDTMPAAESPTRGGARRPGRRARSPARGSPAPPAARPAPGPRCGRCRRGRSRSSTGRGPRCPAGDGSCDEGYGPSADYSSCVPTSGSGSCQAGYVVDCNGGCTLESFINDGYCDCAEFACDSGGCSSGLEWCFFGYINDCQGSCTPETWLNDDVCDAALNCAAFNYDDGDCS